MNLTHKTTFSIILELILMLVLSGCNLAKTRPPALSATPRPTASATPSPAPTNTFTPIPSPTPVQPILTPAANPPLIGRIEDTPHGVGSPASVTVMYDPQPLLWSNAWCAKDEKTLADNLAVMAWKFSLDGQTVPLEQFSPSTYTDQETGQICQRYALLLEAWPPGRHTLTKTITLHEGVNDGESDFPPGEQTHTETLFVANPSIPPPADPQVWLTVLHEHFDPPTLAWQTGSLSDEWFTGRARIEDEKYILEMEDVQRNTVFRHPPAVKVLSGPFQVSVTARRLDGAPDGVVEDGVVEDGVVKDGVVEDGACYGLYYHYNYAGGAFYQWTVCDDGLYSLEIYQDEAWDTLIPWTEEQAISAGMPNRLAARIEGSRMTFIVNDVTIASLDDQRLYGGYTGILAQASKDSPARFAFSDFLVQVR